MNNKFTWGVIAGASATLALVAAGIVTVKFAIIDPLEKHEEWIEENKRKANRKALGR